MKSNLQHKSYFNSSYLDPPRMASYGYQLKEILSLQPINILEIGIGNGIVSYALRNNGANVTTLDIDSTLKPDIIGSILNIPFQSGTYDVVACFEVLEHLPWPFFPEALSELYRLCRKYSIISLPDSQRVFRIHFPPIIRSRLFINPFFTVKTHQFNGEHYWEINKKGYPLKKIMDHISMAGFLIEETYRIWELNWHRFFRLRKINTR